MLQRAGATRHLKPIEVKCDLPSEKLDQIRGRAGLGDMTWSTIEDKTIRGLDALLDKFEVLDPNECRSRALDLWDALRDLNKRRGSRPFEGAYTWGWHFLRRVASFDAAFVRTLNFRRWIPDSSGSLRRPGSVAFEETEWEPDTLLQSKIVFKPTLLDQLAINWGIEPGALELLREMDVTSEAELRMRLGVNHGGEEGGRTEEDNDGPAPPGERRRTPTTKDESDGDGSESDNFGAEEPPSGNVGPRQFFTYVGVEREDEEDADPDGLEHSKRMDLERSAIKFILDVEPDWQPTEVNNRGFDLYRGATIETATHWCEVKAMTGTLDDRDVGISSAQFKCARDHGDAYWLYVVERAGTDAPNLVRIQDPVGKAKTFTFDRGWRAVATALDGSLDEDP